MLCSGRTHLVHIFVIDSFSYTVDDSISARLISLTKAKHTDLSVRNTHLKSLLTSFSFSSSHSLADFAFVMVSIVVKV